MEVLFHQQNRPISKCSVMQRFPDETMSAASYRMHRDGRFWGFMMPVINLMFFWQGPDHCYNAYKKELTRVQYPDEYQKPPDSKEN